MNDKITATKPTGAQGAAGALDYASATFNDKILFIASILTLIAAGMGFSIRGDILGDWGRQFGFTQSELGQITGMGLFGFGLTIIFFSFFADLVGYGWLMVVAFLFHIVAALTTLAAPFAFEQYGKEGAYWFLFVGALCFSFGNGTCEAVINPLTAALFPKNKTHYLNILHAGWPAGLVLGALFGLGLNKLGVGWQVKWGIVLAPMVLYGILLLGRGFPRSEASASGVSMGEMMGTLFAPVLLFLFVLHALVGYVELGTDSWIINITETVLANKDQALIAFIWTNLLMTGLRFFAGPIVHKISPLGLLFASAVIGTTGLWMLGQPFSNSTAMWLAAVTVYGVGKTFYWPTMLGVVSERYPRGGALALGLCGGIGMLSAGLLGGPVIGYKQDYAASTELKQEATATYDRYKTSTEKAPVPGLPKIAGLDNGKIGVLDDYTGIQKKIKEATANKETLSEEKTRLPLERDIEILTKANRKDKDLDERLAWWKEQGQPNATEDEPKVQKVRLNGGKTALTWTAAVPAVMALGYLLLIIYFRAIGGYKAEVLVGHAAEDEKFTGGTMGPGEG